MAMLAERRQKVKWVLNPRQTAWSNDSNKFGQKYLEKLGWKAGQGIGANLQGCTEHIKVSVRSDNRGIGFKGVPEDVLPHQNDFSNLLAQLASNVPSMETEPNMEKSLEVKSRRSKARVHYHKFTRSKDLTMYSQKDLTCILGKPTRPNTDPVNKHDSTMSEANVVQQDMQSYFAKKMKRNSVEFVKENATNVTVSDCYEDSNSDTGFGFNKNIDNLTSSAQQNKDEELNECVKKVEKKRKKHRESTEKINKKSGCLAVEFSTSPNKDPVDEQDSTLPEANFVQQGDMQAYFTKKMKHNSVGFVKENATNVNYDCDEDSNSYTGFGFNKNIDNLTSSAQQNKEEELNEFVKKVEKKLKKCRESTEKINNKSGCLEVDFSTSLSVIKDVEPDGHVKKSRKKRKISCAKLTETEDNLLDVDSTEFKAQKDVQGEADQSSDKLRKKRKINRHADVTDGESQLPKRDHIDQEMAKSDPIKKSGKRHKEKQSEVTDRIEEDRLQSLCDSNEGELSKHKKKLKRKQNCLNENVSVNYGCDINEDLSKSVEISSKKKNCEKIAASVNEDPSPTTVGIKKIQLLEVEETCSEMIKKQRKKLKQACQYIEMKSNEEDGGISISRELNENIDELSVNLSKRKKKHKKDEVLEKVECDGLLVAECTQNLLSDEVDVTEKGNELSKKQRNYCGTLALSEVNSVSQKKRKRESKECIEMYYCANWLPLIDTCETVQAVKNNKPNETTELLRSKVKKRSSSEPTCSDFLPNVSCNKRNMKHTRCSEPQFNDVLVSFQEQCGTVDCKNGKNIHQKLNEGKLACDTRYYVTSQQTEAIEEQQGCTIISEVNALGSNENLCNNANHVKSEKQLVVVYEGVKYVNGISEHSRRLPRRCWYSNEAMKTIPQWERNDVFDGFPGSNVERLGYG